MTNSTITYLNTSDLKHDKEKIILLAEASIQAYNAFNKKQPDQYSGKVIPPDNYEFVECWTGVDAVFNKDKTVEIYGVVFRTKQSPYTYIFAFRGTDSTKDLIDDFGFDKTNFSPYKKSAASKVSSDVKVESGFYRIYSDSDGTTPSMQDQVFTLVNKYNASDKPISQLYSTGHSLGCTLSTLFILDLALSKPDVNASSYNYASPRVGNQEFVDLYMKQKPQQSSDTRTIRIQNVYDKVPCVPLKNLDMKYVHLPYAYLVSFYRDNWTGKFDIVDNHSIQNYKTVLSCAFNKQDGVCEETFEYDNGKKMKSVEPIASKVCTYWQCQKQKELSALMFNFIYKVF